uniref:MPN domain-containing protein n=1 Tax=Candidatus Kentrum eta TaxID=2126337 RepID=A0A450V3G6_9GAMM|nr:MAG: conserved hypothetical protein (putative transposase or invertase) [Candidatus Kentron sp. H]VFJ92600.1 MAG: conserved hypothetical protein (putative transposase or invertase) [Candidatus Kentron sp. H]VFJ99352.1 MAG: conserved hypothetical protein (putative transposase or invertase) [Candidatus Kentron sp. H]
MHNHPAGEVRPSDADKDLTDHLIQVGRILNIHAVDHLIIAPETFFSFEITGLMAELRESTKYVPPYEVAEKIRKTKEEWMERGMWKGIREGEVRLKKEKGKIARALLDKGMDISEISEISGLSEEEIQELLID